jgi:membrane associated rhomboid family serine protease
MFEFGEMFESSAATTSFVIVSAVCIGLNALFAAWLWFHDKNTSTTHAPSNRLKIVAATSGASLLLLASIGAGLLLVPHRQAAAVSAQGTSMSVDEIHRGVDVNALPVQELTDYQ